MMGQIIYTRDDLREAIVEARKVEGEGEVLPRNSRFDKVMRHFEDATILKVARELDGETD